MPYIAFARRKKGTLLFDGSANPSAVTTDDTLLEAINKNGGVDTSPNTHGRSKVPSTATISSEQEESKENPLHEDEQTALKGLSAGAKDVYRLVRDKLAGSSNKKVTHAASVDAVPLARHADIIARKIRTAVGKPFTAMDYYRNMFALKTEGDKRGVNALHQAANAGGKMYAQSATDVPSAEKEAVRKQYEGTEQWMKAPNGKPTNLTEDQWGAVRTPAFKAWFGDWEQAARLMLPRHAENLEEAAVAARSIAGKRLTNDLLGVDARVHALAVANVDRLFSRAITEYTHKDRNNDKNIKQIHRMFSPFVVGDNVFVAKLTVKELVQEKEGKRLYSVEALEIKEASRKWNAAYNATEGVLTSFPQEAFDNIIARFLPDDKNCSKIVDENGEPLVVYHGSDADFNVFDRTKGRANMDIQGMFFSTWELDSKGNGANVRASFLNIRKPANEGQGYKALNRHRGQNGAGVKAREDLIAAGFDGVNNSDEEFIAFEPNQIKSVTDNNGAFSSYDVNIYHQKDSLEKIRPCHGEKVGIVA